jgi:hypothetical protein
MIFGTDEYGGELGVNVIENAIEPKIMCPHLCFKP